MSLLSAIYHLGFKIGYRYWRINRYYAKHPDEMQEFINHCRQKAILEPHFPWASFADQCQKSLDKYKNNLRRQ